MEKKIEKIKTNCDGKQLDCLERERKGNYIIELTVKINEIIDRLNEQPEEDWYCECGEPANGGEHICDDEYKKVVEDITEEKENIKDRRRPHDFRPFYENEEFEDTPGEWEEEWHSTPVYNQIPFIKDLLSKAREEGYQNCLDDIWEEARGLRSFAEHDGVVSVNDIEAGLQEAYLNIENKLKLLEEENETERGQ